MQTFKPTPLHEYEASNTPHPTPTGPEFAAPPVMHYEDTYSSAHAGIDRSKMRILILIVGVITLIVFIIVIALLGKTPKIEAPLTVENNQVVTHNPAPTLSDDGSIVVTTPKNGDSLEAPFIITGQAKGYWFNQGFFPISIYDTDRNLVHQTYAIAQGDWTNPDTIIPFKATIDKFDKTPVKRAGHVVFRKGNIIQGMADKEFLIAVEFTKKSRNTAATTPTAACRDGKDNDGDGLIDVRDPGCHSDQNAANSTTFLINGTTEIESAPTVTPTPIQTGATTYTPGGPCGGYAKNLPGVKDGTPLDCFGMPM